MSNQTFVFLALAPEVNQRKSSYNLHFNGTETPDKDKQTQTNRSMGSLLEDLIKNDSTHYAFILVEHFALFITWT